MCSSLLESRPSHSRPAADARFIVHGQRAKQLTRFNARRRLHICLAKFKVWGCWPTQTPSAVLSLSPLSTRTGQELARANVTYDPMPIISVLIFGSSRSSLAGGKVGARFPCPRVESAAAVSSFGRLTLVRHVAALVFSSRTFSDEVKIYLHRSLYGPGPYE